MLTVFKSFWCHGLWILDTHCYNMHMYMKVLRATNTNDDNDDQLLSLPNVKVAG